MGDCKCGGKCQPQELVDQTILMTQESRDFLRGYIYGAAEAIRDYRNDLPEPVRDFAGKVIFYLDGEVLDGMREVS